MSDRKFSLSAYPLSWPDGWTRARSQKDGRFLRGKQLPSIIEGLNRVLRELVAMGIAKDDVLVSSDVPTRLDGMPRSDQREPHDHGVAVYWRKGQNAPMKCIAIDIYNRVADNLCAVAATLQAMRSIERHGGAQVQERTFRGFTALPAQAGKRHWRTVLDLDSQFARHGRLTREIIQDRYRSLAAERHPDRGGSDAGMSELNVARDEALAEIQEAGRP